MKKIILTVSALLAAALGFQCLADENRTAMDVKDDGRSLTITSGEKPVLTYNYAVTPAKEGVRAVYARSGYIHPAYTPSGFIYTNIQPTDATSLEQFPCVAILRIHNGTRTPKPQTILPDKRMLGRSAAVWQDLSLGAQSHQSLWDRYH